MGVTFVTNFPTALGVDGGTTPPMQTSGADFIVIIASWYSGINTPTLSDNKGNTWIGLTPRVATNVVCRIFYAKNAKTGPGHTFSLTGVTTFPFIHIFAYTGLDLTDPFVAENGATVNGPGPLNTGPVTSTVNGSLILSGLTGSANITGPYNATGLEPQFYANWNNYYNVASASYGILQATAGTINSAWSWTGSNDVAVAIAVFRPTVVSTATSRVTQDVVELIVKPFPVINVSQDVVEILTGTVSGNTSIITQFVVELVGSTLSFLPLPPKGGGLFYMQTTPVPPEAPRVDKYYGGEERRIPDPVIKTALIGD